MRRRKRIQKRRAAGTSIFIRDIFEIQCRLSPVPTAEKTLGGLVFLARCPPRSTTVVAPLAP